MGGGEGRRSPSLCSPSRQGHPQGGGEGEARSPLCTLAFDAQNQSGAVSRAGLPLAMLPSWLSLRQNEHEDGWRPHGSGTPLAGGGWGHLLKRVLGSLKWSEALASRSPAFFQLQNRSRDLSAGEAGGVWGAAPPQGPPCTVHALCLHRAHPGNTGLACRWPAACWEV